MERQLVSGHGRVPECAGGGNFVNENDYYIQKRACDRGFGARRRRGSAGGRSRDAVAGRRRYAANTYISARPIQFIK
ncbi:hypothetical protein BSLA_01f4013 [Burkholderia stabilis]|nr:hypothetical protein BSLA_01f4013 [Burkholderia stabilis]